MNHNFEEEKKMTGKSKLKVDADIQLFQKERPEDKNLKRMTIQPYSYPNGLKNDQIKLLIINGHQYPYKNKLIKIRMEFQDDYPKVPIKMFVQKTNQIPFAHANVYQDLGQICHPLLQKNQKNNNISFTHILKKINQLLYQPNFSNAANFCLLKKKSENHLEYIKEIEENAKSLEQAEYSESGDSDSSEDA